MAGLGYQEVPRSSQFGCAIQTTGDYWVRFDLLRRKAESEMRLEGAPPETFASAPCKKNAFLPQSEKSLVLASAQGNLGVPAVARQMRRLFGPRGGAVRQDVLAATDADVSSNGDDVAARATHREAEQQERKVKDGGRERKMGK